MPIKIIIIVIYLFTNAFSIEFVHKIKKEDIPISIKIGAPVDCQLEEVTTIFNGNGKDSINLNTKYLYYNPHVFDVDDSTSFYFVVLNKLFKFSKDGKKLKQIDLTGKNNIDIKYYKNKIYVYSNKKMAIYNSNNLEMVDTISFAMLNYNDRDFLKVSFFYDTMLFLRDMALKGNHKLRYIYRLDSNKISKRIVDDTDFYILSLNCNGCEKDFIKKCFSAYSRLSYRGQSASYTILEYQCNPNLNDSCLNSDPLLSEYYLFDKINNVISPIVPNINKTLNGKLIFDNTRPFVFINERTAFCRGVFKDDIKNKIGKIVFYKIIINDAH